MLPRYALRRRDGFRRKIPCAGERFAKNRKCPRPRRAVVIRRFAARVLVAFVTRPIRFDRIVQKPAIVAVNRQRNGNRQRRERTQRAGHDEIFLRRLDTAFGAFAGHQAEADGEQTIAAQRIIRLGLARNDTRFGQQHVGKPAFVFEPEKFFKRSRRAVGQRRAISFVRRRRLIFSSWRSRRIHST